MEMEEVKGRDDDERVVFQIKIWTDWEATTMQRIHSILLCYLIFSCFWHTLIPNLSLFMVCKMMEDAEGEDGEGEKGYQSDEWSEKIER